MSEREGAILLVDDEPFNIRILADLLRPSYALTAARNGEEALERVVAGHPDLILLDVMMPRMDGHEVCRRLKADPATRDIPVIFVTAITGDEDETRGLAMGAVDYITKPIVPSVVLARVRTHVALARARRDLADQNRLLDRLVKDRTAELEATQDATILAMATLAETRDNETGNHIRRTQYYVRALASELARDPAFAPELDAKVIEWRFKSAPLHDIGKVGVPDAVLLKAGKLTPEEYETMKAHPAMGRDAILATEAILGDQAGSFLRYARMIAYSHHEKWDGSGYPEGLRGEDIPLPGRIMAVADVYDALISARVYKPPRSHEEAFALLREGAGSHFDPRIVAAAEAIGAEFRAIAGRFREPE